MFFWFGFIFCALRNEINELFTCGNVLPKLFTHVLMVHVWVDTHKTTTTHTPLNFFSGWFVKIWIPHNMWIRNTQVSAATSHEHIFVFPDLLPLHWVHVMRTLNYRLTGTRKLPQVCVRSCSFGGSVTWQTGHRLQDVGDELHELGQRLDLWSLGFLTNENCLWGCLLCSIVFRIKFVVV